MLGPGQAWGEGSTAEQGGQGLGLAPNDLGTIPMEVKPEQDSKNLLQGHAVQTSLAPGSSTFLGLPSSVTAEGSAGATELGSGFPQHAGGDALELAQGQGLGQEQGHHEGGNLLEGHAVASPKGWHQLGPLGKPTTADLLHDQQLQEQQRQQQAAPEGAPGLQPSDQQPAEGSGEEQEEQEEEGGEHENGEEAQEEGCGEEEEEEEQMVALQLLQLHSSQLPSRAAPECQLLRALEQVSADEGLSADAAMHDAASAEAVAEAIARAAAWAGQAASMQGQGTGTFAGSGAASAIDGASKLSGVPDGGQGTGAQPSGTVPTPPAPQQQPKRLALPIPMLRPVHLAKPVTSPSLPAIKPLGKGGAQSPWEGLQGVVTTSTAPEAATQIAQDAHPTGLSTGSLPLSAPGSSPGKAAAGPAGAAWGQPQGTTRATLPHGLVPMPRVNCSAAFTASHFSHVAPGDRQEVRVRYIVNGKEATKAKETLVFKRRPVSFIRGFACQPGFFISLEVASAP